MASDVSYRTIRNDFHTHAKTAGLSPFARDLILQCLSANIVGALQRSKKQMSRVGNMRESEVQRGLEELISRKICQYFPEDDLLWLVECADEQAKGPKTWVGLRKLIRAYPLCLQEAFSIRYPIPYPNKEGIPHAIPYSGVAKPKSGLQGSGTGNSNSEQVGIPTLANSIPDPEPEVLTGSDAGHWLREFGQAWAAKHKRLSYGHSGDAKACGALDDVLGGMAPSERSEAWAGRARMFAAFLRDDDQRTVAAAHCFAFFVPRFLKLSLQRPVPVLVAARSSAALPEVPAEDQRIMRENYERKQREKAVAAAKAKEDLQVVKAALALREQAAVYA